MEQQQKEKLGFKPVDPDTIEVGRRIIFRMPHNGKITKRSYAVGADVIGMTEDTVELDHLSMCSDADVRMTVRKACVVQVKNKVKRKKRDNLGPRNVYIVQKGGAA